MGPVKMNCKSEARSTKHETNSKLVLRTPHPLGGAPVSNARMFKTLYIKIFGSLVLVIWILVIRICFGFRYSNFVFIEIPLQITQFD